MSTQRRLKTVIFMGSARDIVPPWGGDTRTGDRVYQWVLGALKARSTSLGTEVVEHDITTLDPLEIFGEGGALAESGAEIRTPQFFFGEGKAPAAMLALRDVVKAADCYIIVTPEYNHALPPALTGLMGTFGGSNYAGKPSAIISYSSGPWGGSRAAVAARPYLSELGCLPVSKMVHLPSVPEMLKTDGTPVDPNHRMLKQLPGCLHQLEWMAVAMANQRQAAGPCP
mmetsp:Transcript_20665/g.61079  ORF Transcript_20665/g.61079 Transcript_20665/m.61079 type:complete len:227 (-) Transcript_20665:220-900(-)|eukprot:CAMPEP_0206049874 /NCGR_PEP_ID=MMETSP1466-20131121/27765_1 /ASSEMBLY_ACC=CAM_ASM_001126 /TAXON_ID=44452 /ORGANISM="Pavlova gyrans, Strain CCMP608" /LENGTH=226 /DNA_ID=CAMNT_0053424973 /DNA_START=70 /DNA_END=750 /DNA_ORIENTATION=+